MNHFNLKQYLKEGRLLKEEKSTNMKPLNEMKKGDLSNLPEDIVKLVESIMQRLGYKMYEIDVKIEYNNYFIILPSPILKSKDLDRLLTVIGGEEYTLGLFKEVSPSTLSIRLNEKVK